MHEKRHENVLTRAVLNVERKQASMLSITRYKTSIDQKNDAVPS